MFIGRYNNASDSFGDLSLGSNRLETGKKGMKTAEGITNENNKSLTKDISTGVIIGIVSSALLLAYFIIKSNKK